MNIYQYDNYKEFLYDAYQEKKQENADYSYRKFAAEAGISNPGYLNDVIKGTRTLSKNACEKIAKAFTLSAQESEFLNLLSLYGQAKKLEKREDYYQKIVFRRSRSSFARINPEQSKYYEDYRYPLIRSAVETYGFKGDYLDFAEFFRPHIPVADIKRCIRDLCSWTIIIQSKNGSYSVSDKIIEPPPTLKGMIKQINKEWIEHGKQAIDLFTPEERHISTILLSASRENITKILEETEQYRKRIFDIVHEDTNPEQVLQLNIQAFPRTNARK